MPKDRTNEGQGAVATTIDEAFDEDADGQGKVSPRGIPSRNVVIDGKRTSIRLDPVSFDALTEIAGREGYSINELCTMIHERNRGSGLTFTAAIRMFLLFYYWKAASEEGHQLAGHGQGRPLAGSPFDQDVTPSAVASRKRTRPGGTRGRSAKTAPLRRGGSSPTVDDVLPS